MPLRAQVVSRAIRALLFATCVATAAAGWALPEIDPPLEQALAQAAPSDWLRIGVSLRPDGLPREGPARAAAIAARQQQVLDALPAGSLQLRHRYQTVAGFAGFARPAAVRALMHRSDVRSVYLDGTLWPALAQGVPQVGADVAHALGLTGQGIAVAILDSGIDTDHPDLADDLLAQQCYCSDPHPSPRIGSPCCPNGGEVQSGPGAAEDDLGHGTNVAGIVSSGGVKAPPGVAPDAGIVAIRVGGSTGTIFSDVDLGLEWVLQNRNAFADPIRVVNLSLSDGGQYASTGNTLCGSSNTADLIAALAQAGVVTFAASGNDGYDGGISYPACVAEAISVGGVYDAPFASITWCSASGCSPGLCTDTNVGPDDFVCHTNSGALLDLLAPDYRTATSGLSGGVQMYFGGTSAASPYAAGQAALLLQADPSLTPGQIRSLLKGSGTSVVNPDNGLAFPRSDVGEVAGPLLAVCGNGALEAGEACDDGGTLDGDCCAADCQLEASGSACDDANACTTADACDGAGSCQGGAPPDCDDANACTAESCDALLGCVSTPIEGCGLQIPAASGPGLAWLAALLALTGSALARGRRR